MKKQSIIILLTMLFSMAGVKAFAYSFAAVNAYGVTIYYKYGSNPDEVEVTYERNGGFATYGGYEGDLVIPEYVSYNGNRYKVTGIGDYAFDNCFDLTSVSIPKSIKRIGNIFGHSYWERYVNLNAIHINDIASWCDIIFQSAYSSNYNPLLRAAQHLYFNGVEIKDLVIPDGVTTISDYVFSYCENLNSVTFPNTLTTIGVGAFSYCNGITSIIIPNSVTTIKSSAFKIVFRDT